MVFTQHDSFSYLLLGLSFTLHWTFFFQNFTDKQKHVAGIVPAIEKARLYRGKGGEIMRSAVSRFIECISLSHVSLSEKIKRSLLDTLNENLRHPNSQIQVLVLLRFLPFDLCYLLYDTKF